MNKLNLDKKKAVTILSCVALATALYGCMPQKKETKVERETISEVKTTEKEQEQTNKESIIDEYLNYLKEEMEEVESYASDKLSSEEFIQKKEDVKDKFKTLVDFVFNGKEINGITFSELKEEEKEKILEEVNKLDNKIDEYIPDYKERFKNWFHDKTEDAKDWIVDKSADLRETWEEYKSEVEEEYRSRKL